MSSITYTFEVDCKIEKLRGNPAPDYTCGHSHKSLDAAEKCGSKLYSSKYVRGVWQACAKWHGYYILNEATGEQE